MSREYTNRMFELMDDKMIEPYDVAQMCLKWMSEYEVKEMMEQYGLAEEEEEEE